MFIIEILKNYGIDLFDSSIPAVVSICLVILILSIFCLLSFFNILLYFLILLNKDNIIILNIVEKHWILKKLFTMYCNTTKIFLVSETILFLWSLSIIIMLTFKLVNGYFHIINL